MMGIPPNIELATPTDWPQIADLLNSVELPLDGLAEHLESTFVAEIGNEIVGCAGLELYGDCALLRSVAVSRFHQGQGLGQKLTLAALDLARMHGTRRVFLLTETAGEFFPRFGFKQTSRSDVPEIVQKSVEFTSVCPVSALVMVLSLESKKDFA